MFCSVEPINGLGTPSGDRRLFRRQRTILECAHGTRTGNLRKGSLVKNIGNIVKTLQNIMRKDAGVSGDAQRIEQLGWMLFLKILDDKDEELELIDRTYKSADAGKSAMAEMGGRSGRDYRRRVQRRSSTRSCFPSSRSSTYRPATSAPSSCARSSRAPTTT